MPYQPDSNVTRNCQKGRYLWGKTSSTGDVFFGRLTFPSIDLGQPGTYEMTYHVVMFCDGAACSNSGDSIKVIVNEKVENIFETIDYGNIVNQRRWEKRSFRFAVGNPVIEVYKSKLHLKLYKFLFKKNYPIILVDHSIPAIN